MFAATIVGLFLPWEQTGYGETRSGFAFLSGIPIVGLSIVAAVAGILLGIRGTRRAAFARATLAVIGLAPIAFVILVATGLGGVRLDIGVWISLWALVGGFITNVLALAGFRPTARPAKLRS